MPLRAPPWWLVLILRFRWRELVLADDPLVSGGETESLLSL